MQVQVWHVLRPRVYVAETRESCSPRSLLAMCSNSSSASRVLCTWAEVLSYVAWGFFFGVLGRRFRIRPEVGTYVKSTLRVSVTLRRHTCCWWLVSCGVLLVYKANMFRGTNSIIVKSLPRRLNEVESEEFGLCEKSVQRAGGVST